VLACTQPGTGKSTTIAAIATFLHKDLHYVSLGTVRTNAELRSLFDHVTRNCANGGGIVVMEDVDAMSPVVLRRVPVISSSSSSSSCSVEASSTDPLTLDFMLNMLQGTLTIDGMVFVATTNHLELLDPAFYREGRFDVVLRLGACDRAQVRAAFRRFFGRDPRQDVLERVEEDVHTPAAIVARLARFLCSPGDDEEVLSPFFKAASGA
jgi:chaperone BCS1